MLSRTPEQFTRGYTGPFKKYDGVIHVLEVMFPDEGYMHLSADEPCCAKVSTSAGIFYCSTFVTNSEYMSAELLSEE